MGGDQFNQLISEYLSKNMGFIIAAVAAMVLCVLTILFGIVMHFVTNANAKKAELQAAEYVTKKPVAPAATTKTTAAKPAATAARKTSAKPATRTATTTRKPTTTK